MLAVVCGCAHQKLQHGRTLLIFFRGVSWRLVVHWLHLERGTGFDRPLDVGAATAPSKFVDVDEFDTSAVFLFQHLVLRGGMALYVSKATTLSLLTHIEPCPRATRGAEKEKPRWCQIRRRRRICLARLLRLRPKVCQNPYLFRGAANVPPNAKKHHGKKSTMCARAEVFDGHTHRQQPAHRAVNICYGSRIKIQTVVCS